MKKKLQPVLTLLQHYMAQDMTVYAGHATLFLLTAFFPLLMWLLVVVNTLPGFTVEGVVELFFRFLQGFSAGALRCILQLRQDLQTVRQTAGCHLSLL